MCQSIVVLVVRKSIHTAAIRSTHSDRLAAWAYYRKVYGGGVISAKLEDSQGNVLEVAV